MVCTNSPFSLLLIGLLQYGIPQEIGDLEADPFFEDAHRFAAFGVDLGFAPGSGFGEAEAMEDLDDDAQAEGGADDGNEHGFADGLGSRSSSGWWGVGFGSGDEFLHGD